MPLITLRHEPTTRNAPLNAADLAARLRDSPDPHFQGQQATPDGHCTMCGIASGQLYVIVLDRARDDRVQIGFNRCRSHYLCNAVRALLAEEERGNHAERVARMARLRDALQHLGCSVS